MKVKLRPLPQQVASVLVRRIATGELPNGLAPSEVQICIEFGVSRAVAREALKILSALDMVDIAQGRRIIVRPADEWDYMSPLLVEWLPSPHVHELLKELHEARLVFEPAIAAKAAQTLTDASIARLRDCLDAMATHEDDPDRYLELDLEFHMGDLPRDPQPHPRSVHVFLSLVAVGKSSPEQPRASRAAGGDEASSQDLRGLGGA